MISDTYRHPAQLPANLRFLAGGGLATEMILARDWTGHPLGDPAGWPSALKTALSMVLNSPESMILAWGHDTLTFFFNETYFPLLGPRLSTAMGAPFAEVWSDAWAQAAPIIDEAFSGRSQRFVDLPWKLATDRGAEDTWWTFSYSRILDADGGIAGLLIFTNETTQRVLTDAALRSSEAVAQENIQRVQLALAAGAIIGTWFWDLPSDRFTIDEGFAAAFGIDPALGRDGLSLEQIVATVHPDDQEGLAAAINASIVRGGAYAHQYRVRRVDGRYHWIEANGHVVHDADGTPLTFPGVLLDVEARRAVEDERNHAIAALRTLNDTLEQRVADRTALLMQAEEQLRQAQKMEAVGQLTGGLAHDFNNLLTAVMGNLELLQTRVAQGRLDDLDRFINAAQGAGRRAATLTQRLLAFSRRQTLDPKPTDVNRLISGLEDMLHRTVGATVDIAFVGAPDLWTTNIDAGQLENAILNLCINARDAMPDGGRLLIETENVRIDDATARTQDLAPGHYISICVTDSGTGMAPDVIARAFEPFYTTKPIGLGTGLGLSMIYGFVRQSGGQVRIDSRVGHGTTICIQLPRQDGDVDDDVAEPSRAPATIATGQTILVVDDEAAIRHLIDEVLDEKGYTVIGAADGAAGLKVLQSGARIELLITDVGLPNGMNGRQVADAARVFRPGLKILFITGFAETAAVGNGHLDPGMELLTKPFTLDALVAKVSDMLKPTKR